MTLALLALSGFFLLYHRSFFQPLLSPGDHGRDLYCFEATMRGAMPYRDYWWVYGPLMPYYYAVVNFLLGVNIHSVLLGKMGLDIIAGLFFFLSLSTIGPVLLAYVATLWFWAFNPDFFFTYNHAGGITMLLAATHTLFVYLKQRDPAILRRGLWIIFILCFIKLNFGLATLAGYLGCVALIDRTYRVPFRSQKNFYLTGLLVLPLVTLLGYLPFVWGLSAAEIRQCLPYLKGDQPYTSPVSTALFAWINGTVLNALSSWPLILLSLLVQSCVGITVYRLASRKTAPEQKKEIGLVLVILLILFTVNFHEYLVSGVFYRSFWTKPFSILLMFSFLIFAVRGAHKTIQILLTLPLGVLIFMNFYYETQTIRQLKAPDDFLTEPKGQIFVGNSASWVNTVEETVKYINARVPAQETFFALPYDPLYYFLSGRASPTRQLIFFEHINIPPQQEQSVIAELEKNKVNYVLVSSRAQAVKEPGLGVLGETYCPAIGKYLLDNFEQAALFGDWVNEPGWAWNHGTMILKRKKN